MVFSRSGLAALVVAFVAVLLAIVLAPGEAVQICGFAVTLSGLGFTYWQNQNTAAKVEEVHTTAIAAKDAIIADAHAIALAKLAKLELVAAKIDDVKATVIPVLEIVKTVVEAKAL